MSMFDFVRFTLPPDFDTRSFDGIAPNAMPQIACVSSCPKTYARTGCDSASQQSAKAKSPPSSESASALTPSDPPATTTESRNARVTPQHAGTSATPMSSLRKFAIFSLRT